MNHKLLFNTVDTFWDKKIIPVLTEYIKIPNKSPSFDPEWEKHGHMDRVLNLALEWANENKPDGSTVTIERTPGRTPIIMVDIP